MQANECCDCKCERLEAAEQTSDLNGDALEETQAYIVELRKQRDDLFSALKAILPFVTGPYWPGFASDKAVDFAISVVTNVEKEKGEIR